MSNKNKANKNAVQLLVKLGLWSRDAKEWDDLEVQDVQFKHIFKEYLSTHHADDYKSRNTYLVLFGLLEELYKILVQYSDEDYEALHCLIINNLSPCITETQLQSQV